MSEISQQTRILRMLRKAGSKGVPNYEFPKAHILRLSARLGELRKEGYNIICERDYLPNGRATNVFRYVLIEQEPKKKWWQR